MGEVPLHGTTRAVGSYSRATCSPGAKDPTEDGLHGNLAHKKTPPLKTLPWTMPRVLG